MLKYDELVYIIEIQGSNGGKYRGKFSSNSLDRGRYMEYSFSIPPCSYSGKIDMFQGIDSLMINNTFYYKVHCSYDGSCFSEGIGFIRFIDSDCDEILTLIK